MSTGTCGDPACRSGSCRRDALEEEVLDVLAEHRRVRNVRECSAPDCSWRPARPGDTSDPQHTLERHADFNRHLARLIVEQLEKC